MTYFLCCCFAASRLSLATTAAGRRCTSVCGSLFSHILFISVKHSKTGQSPELLLPQRGHQVDPVLPAYGFIPSVKNWDAGENMSGWGFKGETQCHCLTCASDVFLCYWGEMCPQKGKKDFALTVRQCTQCKYKVTYTYYNMR